MVSVEYGPCIFLISLGSEEKSRLALLDTVVSHDILTKIIDKCLKQKWEMNYSFEPHLSVFSQILIKVFSDLNNNNLFWKPLITWFFYHLFISEFSSAETPILLRNNNRIFLETYNESNFPIEILSLITENENPLIFEFVNRKNTSNKEYPSFTKYRCITHDGQQALLMPEFPLDLRRQLYNFYDLLIDIFNSLEFTGRDEKTEAPHVFKYLTRVRDFLGPDELFLEK